MVLRKDNFLIHPDEFIARARNLQSVLKASIISRKYLSFELDIFSAYYEWQC